MSKHRKIPLPPSMLRKAEKGMCRWCDKPILKPDGTPAKLTWHPKCVGDYSAAAWPMHTRAAVFDRDKGVCAWCGVDTKATILERYPHMNAKTAESVCRNSGGDFWQADHIKPLIEANGRLEYWLLGNLQTLCTACHAGKGTGDNDERKAIRLSRLAQLPLTLCAATKPDDGTTLGRVEPTISAPLVEDGRNSSL